MTHPTTVAVCADDYAMTRGISAGIREALDVGVLSATSVMTTSRWWPDEAGPLKRYAAKADIGLHLNLTLGAPLAAMPSLAPSGRFPDLRTLLKLDRTRALPLGEIGEEIDRQCQAFIDASGGPPDHVDGHQHVHVLRSIRPVVFAVLRSRGWRPWLRDGADRLWRLPWRHGFKKALVVNYVADGFSRDALKAGFAINDGFAGFSPFDPARSYSRQYNSFLRMPGPRHLVMCHPGYVDDELRGLDPVIETREQELRYLTSASLPLLGHRQMTIGRLSALL